MATIRHDIQFIHSHEKSTLGAKSAEAQRQVHSHAARAAHAKTRRQRVIQYQATKAIRNDFNGKQPPARAADEVQVYVISGPIAPLGCCRRDPFATFARRLSPTEDFLLDYWCDSDGEAQWRIEGKGHNVFLYDIIRNDIVNSEIMRVVTRAKTAAQPVPALPLGRRKRSNGGSVAPLRDPIQIAGPRFSHYHGGPQTVSRYA
ncbi:hypothetical protein CCHR01_03795 [Colletotrichum chrysophilum]|uniref:Uncharacterized protein n=1 Tax=Colletotrichum chrysophilum TaxID=1836956 RepID=A0AAD9AS73_9PEZI|nr:hypothetical protein CCHR01_03795 [Colletotrichum chrysophilum]